MSVRISGRCHKEVAFVGVHGEENWRFEIIQLQLVRSHR